MVSRSGFPFSSKMPFKVVDNDTGGSADEFPNDWTLAVGVRYQEILVSFELKQISAKYLPWVAGWFTL